MEALAALPAEGALLELPPATTGDPPLGRWRDRVGLSQPRHGHPVGGTMMNLPASDAARNAQATLQELMRSGRLSAAARAPITEAGFRWLVLYPAYRPVPAEGRRNLESCFGPPVQESDEVWVFDLSGETSCESASPSREPEQTGD